VTAEPILEVKDLRVSVKSHRREFQAVDGVSFTALRGQAMGLVGESGSGKSMTLKAILGLLPRSATATGGSVVLDGKDLLRLDGSDMNEIRGASIGMVFQEPMTALNPVKTIGAQSSAPGRSSRRGCSGFRAFAPALRAADLRLRVECCPRWRANASAAGP
jgi:peptide/nickel transport system permease protein